MYIPKGDYILFPDLFWLSLICVNIQTDEDALRESEKTRKIPTLINIEINTSLLLQKKGERFAMPDGRQTQEISSLSDRRASSSACKNASMTIEAAAAVPLFFLAVLCLFYFMEVMTIRTSVRAGLQAAGKQAMQDAYILTAVTPAGLEKDIVRAIGAERLERSIVEGGSTGIHCEGSFLSPTTGIGTIRAKYKIRLPIPMFGVPPVTYEESMRIKAWTGYEKEIFGKEDEGTVYITETGVVYHRDYHCTHLDLSIRMAQASDIDLLRNGNGGKYYACEHCGGKSLGGVYITDTGDRYHSSLSCGGLKRTVYAVPISEAAGKGACSRCGR